MSSEVWVSSDPHFWHKLVAVEKRGFPSVEDHNEAVIGNWNRLVRPDDLVWLLGDVGFGPEDLVLATAARLNGRIQLVGGNHDAPWPGNRRARHHQKKWLQVFESVQPFAAITVGKRRILLSHFPYEGDSGPEDRHREFRLRDEGRLLFHGHTHSAEKVTGPRSVHVGLDAWDLTPVRVTEAARLFTGCD